MHRGLGEAYLGGNNAYAVTLPMQLSNFLAIRQSLEPGAPGVETLRPTLVHSLTYYRAGVSVCEGWCGANLSYRLRTMRMATMATRIATATYFPKRPALSKRSRLRGASAFIATGSMNRYPFLGTVSI